MAVTYDEKSAGAVIYRDTAGYFEFLIVSYAYRSDYWGLVKGHQEGTEDDRATAAREVAEETGLTGLEFDPEFRVEISYQPKPGVTKLVVFLLAHSSDDAAVAVDGEELDDHAWLTFPRAIDRLTYATDRKVVAQAVGWLANRRRQA